MPRSRGRLDSPDPVRHRLHRCPSRRSRSGAFRVPASSSRESRPSKRVACRASSSSRSTTSAVRDTIARFEETGSPVVTDGEQRKPSFVTYPIAGLETLEPDGVTIPFADGHTRRLPRARRRPVPLQHLRRHLPRAGEALRAPARQAGRDLGVGDEPALPRRRNRRLPARGVPRRRRGARRSATSAAASTRGAHAVQIDFTEGRLAVKLDPSRQLLQSFVDLNNRVLDRFTDEERTRIGVHTCPGGDQRLDAQRRRRLRRAAAAPLHPPRRTLLHPARERARPAARAARDRRPRAATAS